MAGQLPRGQPLEPADEASDPEAAHDAAAAGGPPVHLVFHREVAFEVPPEQVQETVAAIVHMQPLPASPRHGLPAAAAGSPPEPGLVWYEPPEQLQEEGMGSRDSSFHSVQSGIYPAVGGSDDAATSAARAGMAHPGAAGSSASEGLQPMVPPPPRPAGSASTPGDERASTAFSKREGPPVPPAPAEDASSPARWQPAGRRLGPSAPASPATPGGRPQPRLPSQRASPSPAAPLPAQRARQATKGDEARQAGSEPSASSSWPGAAAPARQQTPSIQSGRQAAAAPLRRRSRLAVGVGSAGTASPPEHREPAGAPGRAILDAHNGSGSGIGGAIPASSSADEPQLTEIRGDWPPPPSPPQRIPPPSPRGSLVSAFSQEGQAARGGPGWRQLDDGSWMSSAEVDWYDPASCSADAAHTAAAAAAALLSSPLVEAASQSPPLSPVSTQLLALRRPSADVRRGPHRAASLGLGPAERQHSLLSAPKRQHSLLPADTERQASASPHRLSYPTAPPPLTEIEPAPVEDAGVTGTQEPEPLYQTAGSSSSSGRTSPAAAPLPHIIPVLNASPDVTPSTTPGPSPFPLSAFGGDGYGGRGGYSSPGPLPLEGVWVDKREHRRPFADLSPREAYMGEERGWRSSQLRTPLLAPPPPTESEAEEGFPSLSSLSGQSHNFWSSTALLVTPMLGAALLAVPHAVALLGLAGAGISLAAVALAALTSQQLLISAARRGGRMRDGRYADAVRPALGGVGAAVADVALALTCFGLMTASFIVLGDVLVVDDSSDGLLGQWGSDRAVVLAVLALVVVAPLTCFRSVSRLAGTCLLAWTASAMAAAVVLALAVLAATQCAVQPTRAWPDWRQLSGGRAGWFGRATGFLAVAPVLLLALLNHAFVAPVAQQLRPFSVSRTRGAAAAAQLYVVVLAALLGACCYALFGSGVQANVLLDVTPGALVSLAGDPLGRAAYLLVRLAFAVCLVAGVPLLMGPFRDSLWHLLFWQPLLRGPGFYLVTLLVLGGALAASLATPPDKLWQLLSLLGATGGALLAAVLPGLAAAMSDSGAALKIAGITLMCAGVVVSVAGLLQCASM